VGFPDPAVSTGFLHQLLSALSNLVGVVAPCLVLCDDRLPVPLPACHQCPDHPGGFVGKRDRCDFGRSPFHKLHKPWSPGSISLGIADDRHRTDHEHLAQIPITCLGDAAELLLASARVLLWHKSDPGGEAAPRPERVRIGDRRDKSTC